MTREDMIEELREERARLCETATQFIKDIKVQQKKLLAEHKKLTAPKRLSGLRVTWVQDGEEKTIGPLGDVAPAEFWRAVDAIPNSVRAQTNDDSSRLQQIKGDLRRLPVRYNQEKKKIETKIYHCDVKIAKLEEGAA